MQFITFYIENSMFGINILQVKELNHHLQFTEIPLAKNFVKGFINLRGQVITIFDLGVCLGFSKKEISQTTRNIILKNDSETIDFRNKGWLTTSIGDDPVGFLVDRIGDVIEIKLETIKPVPANVNNIEKEYVSGVAELENDLMNILDIEKILEIEL